MNEPNIAYRNRFSLFLLPTSLGISNSTAQHFTFTSDVPPPKKKEIEGVHFIASVPGVENPRDATANIK